MASFLLGRLPLVAVLTAISALCTSPVFAQPETGFDTSKQWTIEQLGKNHVKLTGAVEAQRGEMRFFADEIESWTDTNRVVARGNVVFLQGRNRIAAERADFNTKTRTGTFFNATGSAVLTEEPKRDMHGGQDGDVYFYGAEIEKIGPKKYKITRGGFSTCVQPTPRWEVTSGTVILNLDHYAFLTNALLRAKSIPVLYLPVLYYPINKEDRATGFLMPAYGTSTYRGFTLSNAFFWAINRSHDATVMHDWFAKRGQGVGGEYRYTLGPTSQGNLRVYRLAERESIDASGQPLPAGSSFELRGSGTYGLARGWTARGNVDYSSSMITRQLYHTNIYDASNSRRTFLGSVNGRLFGLGINGQYDRTEYFSGYLSGGEGRSTVSGSTPRVSLSRGERPLFGVVYYSANGEYVKLARQYKDGGQVTDYGLSRVDFAPTIRVPFTSLRWLTVNSSVGWHDTFWTKRRDPEQGNDVVDRSISRRYFDLQSRISGPMVNRVWNTPDSGYAEKWKHAVEPFVDLRRVSAIDNAGEIVQLEGTDYAVGGTTTIGYGVTNRLLVKRKGGPGNGSSREIVRVDIRQSYYTRKEASNYDRSYGSSFSGRSPSNFSPVSLSVTATPAERANGRLSAEYDPNKGGLLSLSGSGELAVSEWLRVNGEYSRRRLGESSSDYVNGAATLRTASNRVGGAYTFSYDIGRSTMLNSRVVAYYNAQCCGFAVEYQTYNFPGNLGLTIPQDNRFNFSFTLAGLGTFSNFFGALGGSPR